MATKLSNEIDVPYDEQALNDIEDPELSRVTEYLITLIKFLRNQFFEIADAVNVNASPNITIVDTTPYTVVGTDEILHVEETATAVVSIILPTLQATADRVITVKDADGNAAAFNITISTEGSETIDGAATKVMNVNFMSLDLYLIEGNWYIF